MNAGNPSFSILTPCLNGAAFLKETVQRVLSQQGNFDLEMLVIDGGSTDGTLDFLKSITDPRLQWKSEPDEGQASAVNKGLAMAKGEFIGWLNGDDLYSAGALKAVRTAFENNPKANWIVGQCDIIDAEGKPFRAGVTRYKNRSLAKYSYRSLLRENCLSQPAVFWRREFGEKIGQLDESLHHAMDYDLWLRMGKVSDPIVLDQVFAHFRIHSQSKSGRLVRERFDEDMLVARRYLGNDSLGRICHRLNIEKIVWAYRLMRLFGK
jgi:glycosyltransferase involved in cell wall biosynthesis